MKKKYLNHRPKRVALVCMGPSATDYLTKTLTQEFDHRWVDEVWAINMAVNPFRADVVFWMDDLVQQEQFKPNLFVALRKFGVPVITSTRRPQVLKKSYDYPIDEVARFSIPIFGKPYLNNGVAMAIAYALWKGVESMSIYGADFSYPNRDYAESGRACVEAWLTIASIKGMNIELCPNTSLMDSVKDHGIYGYSEQPAVDMGDGRKFQYKKISEVMGKYVPEDSSGVKNEPVRARNSGARGTSALNGRQPASPNEAARAAVEAIARSGQSVRSGPPASQAGSGEPHQGANPADHDGGGGAGRVQGSAEVKVSPPPRAVGSRRKAANSRGPAGAGNPHAGLAEGRA